MSNFFVIDHSLRKSGGHHYDYTRCVAKSATKQGYLTTIGANQRFRVESDLLQYGIVKPVFRETVYQPESYLAGLQHLTRSRSAQYLDQDEKGWLQRWLARFNQSQYMGRRSRLIRRFAADCRTFFQTSMQVPGDHVFFTTVSEIELLGLAEFLATQTQTMQLHWHLQFHYNLFDGRTPEYCQQKSLKSVVKRCFVEALKLVPHHHLYFYTTSQALADQYNSLGTVTFEELPYPINPDFCLEQPQLKLANLELASSFQPANQGCKSTDVSKFRVVGSDTPGLSTSEVTIPSRAELPIRITCPGEVRREKGLVDYLQPLVDQLWSSHLNPGVAKLVLQRPKRKWYKRSNLELVAPFAGSELDGAIEYFPHPLSDDAYREFVKSTDIGLLYYDSRVYFSRRAGVLGELLSAGKPVIVSAGSWLADQISQPIHRYVEKLMHQEQLVRSFGIEEFSWDSTNVPMPGGVLSFDQSHHAFRFSIERDPNETALVFDFDWHWPTEPGVYCRIDVVQKDSAGVELASRGEVLGHRRDGGKTNCLIPLVDDSVAIEFSLRNRYHDSTATIKNVQIHGLVTPRLLPVGAVGLVADDLDDLVRCINEMVGHIDHYQSTADNFSTGYHDRHDPDRTVEFLLSAGHSLRRAA